MRGAARRIHSYAYSHRLPPSADPSWSPTRRIRPDIRGRLGQRPHRSSSLRRAPHRSAAQGAYPRAGLPPVFYVSHHKLQSPARDPQHASRPVRDCARGPSGGARPKQVPRGTELGSAVSHHRSAGLGRGVGASSFSRSLTRTAQPFTRETREPHTYSGGFISRGRDRSRTSGAGARATHSHLRLGPAACD